jgi:hypothetical protein
MAPLTTPSHLVSTPVPDINNTTDKLPVPIAITTPPLRQKRKLNPLSPPEPGKHSSTIQKQCVLQEVYNPQSWYNTPAFSQTPSLHTFKPSTLSLHPLNPSTMAALRMKVKGFAILTNNEYVELAATINKQLQLDISDFNLEVVDYQFASDQRQNDQRTKYSITPSTPSSRQRSTKSTRATSYAKISRSWTSLYKIIMPLTWQLD